jgi:predicted HTH transcriptional regulator
MTEIELLRLCLRERLGDVPIVELEGRTIMLRLSKAIRELAETRTGGVVMIHQGSKRGVRSAERLESDLRLQFARSLPGVIEGVLDHEGEEGRITLVHVRSRHPSTGTSPRSPSGRRSRPASRQREAADRPELDMVHGATFEDLDEGLVEQLIAMGVVPDAPRQPRDREDFEHAVAASGIAYVQRGVLVPTVAGMVATAKRPDLALPGMAVRVVLEGKGEHLFGGGLIELVDRISELPVLNDGVGAKVIEELLINAVVHRDWSAEARGQPIVLRRSADRLELSHPGALDEQGPSNPTLLRLLVCLGMADGKGEGLSRLRRRASEEGRGGPFLREQAGIVTATITLATALPGWLLGEQPEPDEEQSLVERREPGKPKPPAAFIAPSGTATVQQHTAARERQREAPCFPATPKQQQLIDALQTRRKATTKELAEALDWPRTTTRDVLTSLVKAGQVERMAPLPRSPMQVYLLARVGYSVAASD